MDQSWKYDNKYDIIQNGVISYPSNLTEGSTPLVQQTTSHVNQIIPDSWINQHWGYLHQIFSIFYFQAFAANWLEYFKNNYMHKYNNRLFGKKIGRGFHLKLPISDCMCDICILYFQVLLVFTCLTWHMTACLSPSSFLAMRLVQGEKVSLTSHLVIPKFGNRRKKTSSQFSDLYSSKKKT